jgi:glycerol transport system ATP-binding protein
LSIKNIFIFIKVNLKQHVLELNGHLNHVLKPNDTEFSNEQKYLLCLARVLLRKTKLVLIDEAIINLDYK